MSFKIFLIWILFSSLGCYAKEFLVVINNEYDKKRVDIPELDGKNRFENEDFKNAFNLGKELVLTNPYHSKINYLYSRVLFKLNKYDEALKYGEFAKVYDCANYGANPVYNSILRSVATEARYEFLDFHTFLADESSSNFVFIEEIYPQDVYLKKIIDALARKIKKRLRL